jgi:hypothetical protein
MNRILPGLVKLLYIDKKAVLARLPNVIIVRILAVQYVCDETIIHCRKATILGPSEFLYDPQHPLPPAGTYAYMATASEIEYE